MITLPYLIEILNQKTVGVFLILLLFCALSVSAATPVNGSACWNTNTGNIFQNRTGTTIVGVPEYYNSDPIVETSEICYTYATIIGGKCVIRGAPNPSDPRGYWPAVTITIYECPIDSYALVLGLTFSGFVCFYLRRSLSDHKV